MERKNLLGLCIMAGLIFLGAMMPLSVSKFKGYDRTVNVKGLCEKEVRADKVIWPLSFKVVGNDLDVVYRGIEANTKVIRDFLLQGGISENEITVTVPTVSDKMAQEYGNNDRAYRYVSTSVVTVCTEDVDKVLALRAKQSELLTKGIFVGNSWENPVEFKFEGLNAIKPEMIEEATKNAREVAEKFAKDSDSRLGKIKQANQGTFSIEDRDSNTPHIKKIRVVTNVTYYLSK